MCSICVQSLILLKCLSNYVEHTHVRSSNHCPTPDAENLFTRQVILQSYDRCPPPLFVWNSRNPWVISLPTPDHLPLCRPRADHSSHLGRSHSARRHARVHPHPRQGVGRVPGEENDLWSLILITDWYSPIPGDGALPDDEGGQGGRCGGSGEAQPLSPPFFKPCPLGSEVENQRENGGMLILGKDTRETPPFEAPPY